ncbi:hypothetical protein KIN20_036077 [Parelaphostrongylus tenuis]|uniref:Uncharacterized protein n=1 Tax=Parelaphostrongylus tenuis TaxID=148309 RepID=A0AAD5RCT9_PARTN|nr:hypothetical protein KIN20_036077 [Parelaphostrongylus tenuis]
MSVWYFNEVFKVIEKSKPLRETFVGVAKQTGWTAAGTAAGGLLAGPLGALFGGVAGAILGYGYSDDYDNFLTALRSMTDREKCEVSEQIQTLVKSTAIEAFSVFIAIEANRQKVIDLLSSFLKTDSNTNY